MVVEILIFQIGVTLFIAMLFGAVFAKYKQSSIIGYLLGGILLGPHVLGFVTESQVLTLFSELCVLLLLFFIGLEVDVKKFKEGGLIAFVLGPAKMIICFSLGYFVLFCLRLTNIIANTNTITAIAIGVNGFWNIVSFRLGLGCTHIFSVPSLYPSF